MISVVDYGIGNIQAFLSLYKRAGIECERVSTPKELETASHLILPGVGNFDHAMRKLLESGLVEVLERLVLTQKVPLLGVCVGMQMLASKSEEGTLSGLNWIPGTVRSFTGSCGDLPMPHMGWNTLDPKPSSVLFGRDVSARLLEFYFLHSYYYTPDDHCDVAATASYGVQFAAVISRGNIHGIQCHPEKSHGSGVALLKRFSELQYD